MAKRRRKKKTGGKRGTREPFVAGSAAAPNRCLPWGLLALTVLVAVAFSPALSNGAISFDDPRYVVANAQVQQGLGADFLEWAFTSRHAYNWHPLTWISHAVDFLLFGTWWGGHHAVSVALHLLASLLLVGFLREGFCGDGVAPESREEAQSARDIALGSSRVWLALWVSLLFAVHPLRVESVAWLSERKDTLSAAFFFAALWAYVRYVRRPSRGRWLLWTLLAVGGLMAKPMLVTLPFVLLLLDLWPLRRWRLGSAWEPSARGGGAADAKRLSLGRLLLEKLPLFAAVTGSIGLTLWAQQPIVQDLEQYPLSARVSNAVVSLLRYCGKLVWPTDLGIFYPHPGAEGWPAALVLASVAFVAAASIVAILLRRSMPWLLFGWLWFLGTLVPVIGLVQVGLQSMADRYTYLPSVGLFVALVWSLDHALARCEAREVEKASLVSGEPVASGLPRRRFSVRRLLVVAGSLGVLLLAGLTYRQTEHWRGDVTLLRHTLEATEGSFWAHYNLGLVHQRAGRSELAAAQFEQALERQPDNVETLRNLGHTLLSQAEDEPARTAQARSLFERAAALRPEDPFAQIDLAQALARDGEHEAAVEAARRALGHRPQEASWWMLQGRSLVQLRRFAPAEAALRRATELDGSVAEAWNALGVAVAQQQRYSEAAQFFERALALQPDHAEARRNLDAARALSG